MSNSSAQETYSITLNSSMDDTITLDTSTWANMSAASGGISTITLNNGGSSYAIGAAGTYSTSYTIGAGGTVGGITSIGNINSYDNYTISLHEEWVNCLTVLKKCANNTPDWQLHLKSLKQPINL